MDLMRARMDFFLAFLAPTGRRLAFRDFAAFVVVRLEDRFLPRPGVLDAALLPLLDFDFGGPRGFPKNARNNLETARFSSRLVRGFFLSLSSLVWD